jgi:C_GCAxxG_C_C family probable redox protein
MRLGTLCGAFSGAVMGLGLKFGRMDPGDDHEKLYSLISQLNDVFVREVGSINCPELIGYDLGKPEELAAARASGVFTSKCPGFVRIAARTAAQMLLKE